MGPPGPVTGFPLPLPLPNALTIRLPGQDHIETDLPSLWRVSDKHIIATPTSTSDADVGLQYSHHVSASRSTLLSHPPRKLCVSRISFFHGKFSPKNRNDGGRSWKFKDILNITPGVIVTLCYLGGFTQKSKKFTAHADYIGEKKNAWKIVADKTMV